jgi:iron only hydrogenase large subunit-like protein
MSDNGTMSAPQVIRVDADKCVNCHLCISVCPVKYCNDASDTAKGIQINHDLCIGCGNCLHACSHEARLVVDDTEQFVADLQAGETIATLVAPAIASQLGDQFGSLLAWLKHLGVEMNFDVSFGAEITTYQYLRAIQNGVKTPVIAQPCPAIVSYIEIYKPELLDYLAPTGSPTMDMACWVHANHPGRKLAFISPCAAKKREFDDPNTKGRVQYNVTLANLLAYAERTGVDLAAFAPITFDGPMEAQLGTLYSQPGGLHEAFKRYNVPLKLHQVRRTEGKEIYEEFLEEIEQEIAKGECDVIVVDIINCLHGCNRGTAVDYGAFTTGELLKRQSERLEALREQHYATEERRAALDRYLESMDHIDFSRSYTDKSAAYRALSDPDAEMIEALHVEMGKHEPKDIKNCAACGYNSCEAMAKAVLNGLYRPDQCHHYLEAFYEEHKGAGA